MKQWKKGDKAFVIIDELKDIVQIKLLSQHINPDYFIVSVIRPCKKFKMTNLATTDTYNSKFFHSTKIEALKSLKRVLRSKIIDREDDIKLIREWNREDRKALKRVMKEISKEEKKCI